MSIVLKFTSIIGLLFYNEHVLRKMKYFGGIDMNKVDYKIRLHAPNIEVRFRHPTILEEFDKLEPGQFMELSNDHDPKPLHYQFMIERPDTFIWEYIEEGPYLWRVSIGKK